jgi:hypothetical protein
MKEEFKNKQNQMVSIYNNNKTSGMFLIGLSLVLIPISIGVLI